MRLPYIDWRGKTRRIEIRNPKHEKDLNGDQFDAVLTDPPYFGNVQFAELMDFCHVWLRRLVEGSEPAFARRSSRNANQLTGNISMGRGLDHFNEGLSQVFQKMAQVIKPGAPLVFTYHHNQLEAYLPVAVAILDSGLTCSATIPCPAEMGASIHINGTASSIVETVFVCRSTGRFPRRWLTEDPHALALLVAEEIHKLREAGLQRQGRRLPARHSGAAGRQGPARLFRKSGDVTRALFPLHTGRRIERQ